MAEFVQQVASESAFLNTSQEVVDLLESITPAEKAQAVPYAKIWRIDPITEAPLKKIPLSVQLVTPPSFGASITDSQEVARYKERPPVSLNSIVIKNDTPQGILTYRTLTLSFRVHRPDVVFENEAVNSDRDRWADIIIPGSVFTLEYGWSASSGVKNDMINGIGVSTGANDVARTPGRITIRFAVVNYNFTILPNGEFDFTVQAIENRLNDFRSIPLGLFNSDELVEGQQNPADPKTPKGKKLIGNVQKRIKSQLNDGSGLVTLGKVLNELVAPAFLAAYKGRDLKLFLGSFNDQAGATTKKYGNVTLTSGPIGGFKIPVDEITKILGSMMSTGVQMTVDAFMVRLLSITKDPRAYDDRAWKVKENEGRQSQMPNIIMRKFEDKKSVSIFLLDFKREFVKLIAASESDKELAKTREGVRKVLKRNKIPIISFGKGNSYIENANFSVQSNDQMKSIFIRRYYEQDRTEQQEEQSKHKRDALEKEVLYSSAINGDIQILGTAAFELFGLVWLDFGIKRWDGPFNVLNREDTISPGTFTTRITLQAASDDPLGTQGRFTKKEIAQLKKDNDAELAVARKAKAKKNRK